MREVPRKGLFKCRALRRILGAQRTEVKGNGRNYIVRSITIFFVHTKLVVDKIEKYEILGACRTYGRMECCILIFGGEYLG